MRDYALGTTFDVKFTTRRFSTGAPFTLAGSPAVAAYVDNDLTEITAGITLTVDFDSRTGLNNVRVVATGGNGYATAKNYALVLTAGTVDSVSVVGEVVGEFSIEAQSPLRPTTTARTLDVSAGGEAGIDWANIGAPTTTVNLSGTTIGTLSALAANSVTSTALATSAVDEISDGVWDEDIVNAHTTANTSGLILATTTSVPTATQNADALLNRDMSAVSDTNSRTPLNAFRFIRNAWATSLNGVTLTVYKEDDVTEAWTSTLTAISSNGAVVSGSNPP